MPAFDVFVNEDGQIYRYLINNATFTDTTGKLMMPEALGFGNYELIEQCTAYGYVLDRAPVPFVVDGTDATLVVEKHNIAQKGTITADKTGEVFSSVAETDGIYQPVYDTAGLSGAVYEIYADEDIITPDGTVRAEKDELVATVETEADGFGTSDPLYLDRYRGIEKAAPYSMIVNTEPKFVELTYAGENVAVTETETSVYNERQKATIRLFKVLEQNELFGIGNKGEIFSVQFELFAAEDLTARNCGQPKASCQEKKSTWYK